MAEYFKTFSRTEKTPETPDPNLKIIEGRIQVRNREISQQLQALLRGGALRAEEVMKSQVPKRTEALKNSIRINPPISDLDTQLPFVRGGFAAGLPEAGRGRGPGGVTRTIELTAGGPSINKYGDEVNVNYLDSVLEGQTSKTAPEGKYFIFDPYKTRRGANPKYFRKKLSPDTREGLYPKNKGVVFSTTRNAFEGQRQWLDSGIREGNRYISTRIGKLL